MALSLSTAIRNGILDVIRTALDAGAGPAYIEIRSGTRPANVGTTATGVVLVTIPLNDPAFDAPASGTSALNVATAMSAVAAVTGTASWARIYDSTGAAVFDSGVGTSGQEFILNTTNVLSGAVIALTLGSLTISA